MSIKPKGYWQDFNNVRIELEDIESRIGHFPSISDLENLGANTLSRAIQKLGGMYLIRERLSKPQIRVKRGYWQDINNIKAWALNYINKYGINQFTYKSLHKNGKSNFLNGIKREGYQLKDIYEMLNIPVLFTPKNYLKDINNVLYEVKLLIDKYGCFPCTDILIQERKSGIETAMRLYHGGKANVLNLLGYEKPQKSLLETSVKAILNKWVDDDKYVDNKQKELRKYGLDMQNPRTKQFFEIDRFYYEAKVAVEVHGLQHYKAGGNSVWTQERTLYNIEVDKIKSNMLTNQGVNLLVIPYNKCSEKQVLCLLKQFGKLKLKNI